MPLLQRLFGAGVREPRQPVTYEPIMWDSNARSDAGISVTEARALQVAAVWRAVNLLSGTAASLPLKVYAAEARQPVAMTVLDDPNPDLTSFEFWEIMWFCRWLWGNAYAAKVADRDGQVVELHPLHPANVQVGRVDPDVRFPTGKLFRVIDSDGDERVLSSRQVFHIPGAGYDGLTGVSPIRLARQSLGLALAAEEYGARLFGSGSLMSGVLQTEQRLDQLAADALKARWRDKVAGLRNAHDIAVLDNGAKFQAVGIPPGDAQFLESRRFQIAEVSRWYGIPPHMLFEVERSTSWGTGIEQQGIGMVVYTLRPELTRIEQRATKELLPDGSYAEFVVEGLLRGDSAARASFYRTMVEIRAMNPNEVRVRENLEPYDGGDEFSNPNITTDAAPTEEQAEEDATVVRALMGRLGRARSLDDIDDKALVAGLNGRGGDVLAHLQVARDIGMSVDDFRQQLRSVLVSGDIHAT